jgi:putative transposase
MANTYTQKFVHLVFVVQGRKKLFSEENRIQLEKYMAGIIKNKNSKPIAIYCNPDHTHILLSLHPSVSLSEITMDVKANSSKWINANHWVAGKFSWQKGFGAFTYSKSQIDKVASYILNQKEHHKKKDFREEYIKLLNAFEIKYDTKYLFD